jgi:hypothetical protein
MPRNHENTFLSTAIDLVNKGFCPVLVDGKRPVFTAFTSYMPGWSSHTNTSNGYTQHLLETWSNAYPGANIGVLTRECPSIDIDHEAAIELIKDFLPRTPCVKKGARGITLMYSQSASDPILRTRIFKNQSDDGVILEVLANGRQTVIPPSIHPDTKRPYEWVVSPWGNPPMALGACPLPPLSQKNCDDIEAKLRELGLMRPPPVAGVERTSPLGENEKERYRAYIQPKIDQRMAELESCDAGGRQNALNGLCMALAPYVQAGLVNEEWLLQKARTACVANGWIRTDGEGAFRRQFDKALRDGRDKPLPDLDGAALSRLKAFPGAVSPMGAAPPGKKRYSMGFDGDEALDLPAPEPLWTIDGWIPHEQVSLLYGDGASGKTTLLMQLGVAAARGGSWLGLPVKQRRVLFVSGEDEVRDLRRRHAEVCRVQGRPARGMIKFVSLVSEPDVDSTYIAKSGVDEMSKILEGFDILKDEVVDGKYDMVILDPAMTLYAGNQNSAVSVYSFISLLRKHLAFECGCTVVIAAHPSTEGMKTGTGTSGSVAWNNACRARMYFSRMEDGETMKLELVKANRGRAGAKVLSKWVEGAFVTTSLPTPAMAALNAVEGPACVLYMSLLAKRLDTGESNPPRDMPNVFARSREAREAGISKIALAQAQTDLLNAGAIEIVMVNNSRQLVIAEREQ